MGTKCVRRCESQKCSSKQKQAPRAHWIQEYKRYRSCSTSGFYRTSLLCIRYKNLRSPSLSLPLQFLPHLYCCIKIDLLRGGPSPNSSFHICFNLEGTAKKYIRNKPNREQGARWRWPSISQVRSLYKAPYKHQTKVPQ